MNTSIKIPLSKKNKERLDRLALRYGLSLPDFSSRILSEVSSDISEESFEDYLQPQNLKVSFNKALREYQTGKVRNRL